MVHLHKCPVHVRPNNTQANMNPECGGQEWNIFNLSFDTAIILKYNWFLYPRVARVWDKWHMG